MLQKFYTNTLQSNYIKYILNNSYIPTVPFTNNIMHVTKGNTYIYEGYFVTAKISEATLIIKESIQEDSSNYSKYFVKHQPYIFGEFYPGLTTNYKSNTRDYDPTTHYYLGEYLRAYKAYYNIDLMPYYNCFSNEYLNHLTLEKLPNSSKIIYNDVKINNNFTIISVPIKFCQKYTIAISCPSEVLMLPAFIDKKGLLKDQTDNLNKLGVWGRSYPNLKFNSPIIFESPHINSVSDRTQASLQTYDRYLKLLIQIPSNLKSSITILEGEFYNSKYNSEKIINLSEIDVKNVFLKKYTQKLSSNNLKIPVKNTSLTAYSENVFVCNHIDYDPMDVILINSIDNNTNIKINFKLKEDTSKFTLQQKLNHPAIKYTLQNKIKLEDKSKNNQKSKKISLETLIINSNEFGGNYIKDKNSYKIKLFNDINENSNSIYNIVDNINSYKQDENDNTIHYITKENNLEINLFNNDVENPRPRYWGEFINRDSTIENLLIASTLDKNDKSAKAIIANKGKFLYENESNDIIELDDLSNLSFEVIDGPNYFHYYNYNNENKTCSLDCWGKLNKSLKYIEIPNYIKYNGDEYAVIGIEQSAFKDFTQLEILKLPKTISYIKTEVFAHCYKLHKVIYDGTIEQWVNINFHTWFSSSPFFWSTNGIEIEEETRKKIGLYINNKLVQHANLMHGTEKINKNAFASQINFKSIGIPNTVTNIGEYAFKNCDNNFKVYIDSFNKVQKGWDPKWLHSTMPESSYTIYWGYNDLDLYSCDLQIKSPLNIYSDNFNIIIKNNGISDDIVLDNFINANIITLQLQDYFEDDFCYIKYNEKILDQLDAWDINVAKISNTTTFTEYLNSYMYSNLRLLKINDQISYAFSERLIEYLLNNVITSNDKISKNIKRVQINNIDKINGVWDNDLRVRVFRKVVDRSQKLERTIPSDINGFVDKDSEKLLNIQNKINRQDDI